MDVGTLLLMEAAELDPVLSLFPALSPLPGDSDGHQGILSPSSSFSITATLHVFLPLPCRRVAVDGYTLLLMEAGVKTAASGFSGVISWLSIFFALLPLKTPFSWDPFQSTCLAKIGDGGHDVGLYCLPRCRP